MATNETVKRMLERIASNYSKHDKWTEDNYPTWVNSLKNYPDKLVITACKKGIAEHTRAPNVANLRGIIAGFPSRAEPEKPQGCKRCGFHQSKDKNGSVYHTQYGSGKVEIAHHRSDKNGQKQRCDVFIAACSCPAGVLLSNGAYQPFEPFVDALRSDPYTIAVYHSLPDRPFLSERERYTPEQITAREIREPVNLGSSGFRHIR